MNSDIRKKTYSLPPEGERKKPLLLARKAYSCSKEVEGRNQVGGTAEKVGRD